MTGGAISSSQLLSRNTRLFDHDLLKSNDHTRPTPPAPSGIGDFIIQVVLHHTIKRTLGYHDVEEKSTYKKHIDRPSTQNNQYCCYILHQFYSTLYNDYFGNFLSFEAYLLTIDITGWSKNVSIFVFRYKIC